MSFVNSITIEVYCIQPFISIRKQLLISNLNLTVDHNCNVYEIIYKPLV